MTSRARRARSRKRVVIAGGGVAALEALLALRSLAGHQVEITLVAPEPEFLYRPTTVGEAFGRSQARAYSLQVIADDLGHALIQSSITAVEPDEHFLLTADGDRVPYDALVVATGAMPRPWLPGALTFRGRPDVPALRHLLGELVTGAARSVAFAVPSESGWPLPIYELALMTAAHLREHGRDNEVWLITPEQEPLALFGSAAAQAIAPHRVVTLPELGGPWLSGLPSDKRGFIPVDSYGRVVGLEDVYAAGDATTFPLKQGGLAAQQADAVAETIAADIGVPIDPQPFSPVLRGLLITDGAPLYLRCEPQRLPREATVAIEARHRRRATPRRLPASRCGGHRPRLPAAISARIWPRHDPRRCPPNHSSTGFRSVLHRARTSTSQLSTNASAQASATLLSAVPSYATPTLFS
jgi:sulfide:quinone oxidoreductase